PRPARFPYTTLFRSRTSACPNPWTWPASACGSCPTAPLSSTPRMKPPRRERSPPAPGAATPCWSAGPSPRPSSARTEWAPPNIPAARPSTRPRSVPVQHLAYLAPQVREAKRLAEQVHAGGEAPVVDDGILGVARHVQHPDARQPRHHLLRHPPPRHPRRQYHIGEQQVEANPLPIEQRQGAGAVLPGGDPVTQ